MADIIQTYEYSIPDEQFIDSFVGNLMGSFTYYGPEVLTITIPEDGSAYTQSLTGPVYDGEITIDIDVTANPELLAVASLLFGRPYDFVAEFETITLVDGTVYENQTNKDIHDYYHLPVYDFTTNTFKPLELVVKDTLTPKMVAFFAKAELMSEFLGQFALTTESATILADFEAATTAYRSIVATPWKYPEINPFDLDIPKIPMQLITEVANATNLGLVDIPEEEIQMAPEMPDETI